MAVGVSGLLPEPAGYAELLEQLKARVRASQVRAARAANGELLRLYWSVGRDILDRQEQAGWGPCREPTMTTKSADGRYRHQHPAGPRWPWPA